MISSRILFIFANIPSPHPKTQQALLPVFWLLGNLNILRNDLDVRPRFLQKTISETYQCNKFIYFFVFVCLAYHRAPILGLSWLYAHEINAEDSMTREERRLTMLLVKRRSGAATIKHRYRSLSKSLRCHSSVA